MSEPSGSPTRRQFAHGLVAGGAVLLAGCSDDEEPPEEAEELDPALDVNGRRLSSAFPIELVEPDTDEIDGHASGDDRIASVHWHGDDGHSHWHFGPLEIPHEATREVRVRFPDDSSGEIRVGADEPYGMNVILADEPPEGFLDFEQDDALIDFYGENLGEGGLVVELLREDEVVWESPRLPVEVTDET